MQTANLSALSIEDIVPELSSQIEVHETDAKNFIVHQTEYNWRLKINQRTNRLLRIVDGKKSISEITSLFNNSFDAKVQESEVYALLYKGSLASNGIVKSSIKLRTADTISYLKFRIPLLQAKNLHKLSHLIGFLYNPRTFYLSSFTIIAVLIPIFFHYLSLQTIYRVLTGPYLLYITLFSLFTTLLHEFGHVSACRKFGAVHGPIGAGFYLFMPVFYADVSDAWRLKSSERIIVDFAGIYVELLIATILTLLFLVFNNLIFLTTAFFIFIQTFRNMNPFLRFDAYWAVTDYFNISNLRKESNLIFNLTIYSIFKRTDSPLKSKKDYFLFVYSFLSWAIICIWLCLTLLLDMNSVIYLPFNLYSTFKTIFMSFDTITFGWLKMHFLMLLIPVSFYLIAGNILIKQFQTKSKL